MPFTNDESFNKYSSYFDEDLKAIEEELEKSKKYSKIIDDEINKLTHIEGIGANKGGQRYLIEHITNAVSLQSQRQSLRKDKVAVKKMILDFANRSEKGDTAESQFEELLKKHLDRAKANTSKAPDLSNNENIDDEIDNILDGN